MINLRRRFLYELLALLPVLVLAGGLRFGWAGVNSFAGDEARISLDALRMRGELVMAGQQSSVNIPFLPLSVWLYAIPYRLSSDPLLATGFTAALNMGMVIGVWALARRWNAAAGWLAALFLAASPYAVFYARSIWQPNLLAPLALLWLWLAYAAATRTGRGRTWAVAGCVAVGLSVVQVHFAGAALIVGTAYLFFRLRWYTTLVPVIGGAAFALILALPYVYYITVVDPDVLARFGAVTGGDVRYSLDSAVNLARLALQWEWGFLGKGDFDTYGRDLFAPLLAALLLVNGGIGLLRERFGGRREADAQRHGAILAELALVLLCAAVLTFVRHTSPVLIHYQLIALPAVALLIGAGVSRVKGEAILMTAAIALTAAALWTGQIAATLNYTAVNRPPNSALSSILRESRDVAQQSAPPMIMFAHGDSAPIDGEVAVFEALLWDQPHRVVNGTVLLILPPEPTTLIATLAPFQMWEELDSAGLARDVRPFARREGALPFMSARYDGVSEPDGFTRVDPLAFADGTTLEGWRVRWVGDRFRVSTLWRAGDLLGGATVQQFHHLRDSAAPDGEPLTVSDVPLALHTWRPGDRVIVMADFFDVPPGGYALDVGHYTLPDLQRIPRADGETFARLDIAVPPR